MKKLTKFSGIFHKYNIFLYPGLFACKKNRRRYGAPAKQSQKAGFMHGFCDDRKGRAEHR